jgi:DNA-binding MarR family transcriptional regulator
VEEKCLELIEYELGILVRRASFNKKIGNLERSAYLLLYQVSIYGPNGVKELANEFHLDISTVSRQAAALESKGYVQRLPDPTDGRASYFQITELGMRELTEAKQARMARFSKIFKNWSSDECEKFRELLVRLNRTFID